ncbi:MAG: radical SAM protein [Candidatus Aminicenantes bacterium]|nr:radical SAM protein [Candidatus Aminicenantes bacterium]
MRPSFTYGPVPSRRLGFSLGVDLLPFKTCSMDCVYCQLGPNRRTTVRRREHAPARAVLAEIRAALASGRRIDAVTFSGSGEPTLHAGLGRIIRAIKRQTTVPVVVLTNSSTLSRPEVRLALAAADIVIPSLDAATESVLRRVNRPHPSLTAARIIDGLAAFRRRFKGQIWLEILLVKGINDGPAHLRALRRAIARLAPDRVQLNTVVRPPAEPWAKPLSRPELERIKASFGGTAEIVAEPPEGGRSAPAAGGLEGRVLGLLRRRPETAEGLAVSLEAEIGAVRSAVRTLSASGRIKPAAHGRRRYYEVVKDAAAG